MRNLQRGVVAVLLALLSLRAVAAFADADDDEGWTAYVPPAAGGTVLHPNTPEGGFGSPDRTKFDHDRRSGVLDQVCRHLDIHHEFDFNFLSLTPDRKLDTYPDGTLAVIDDEGIQGSWNRPILTRAIAGGAASIGLTFGVTVGGRSMVVRPTNEANSCDEVKRLLNFRDIKSVFPINADRIAGMELGELWRVPMTLSYSEGIGLGKDSANIVPLISFGRNDTGTTSMTLYRIAKNQVRFRFRIDHVVVHTPGISATQIFTALEFAVNAHAILLKTFEKALASQIYGDAVGWLQYTRPDQHGARVLMEFIVDPTQPEEAAALAEAVKGDFKQIISMAGRMTSLQAGDEKALKDYGLLRQEHADKLGDPSYAASDEYRRKVKPWSVRLPVFITYNTAALFGDDRVVRYTGDEGEFTYYLGDKTSETQFLKLPWLGPMIKENSQRQVTAFTYAAPGENQVNPEVVYIRNRGYLREPGSAVRRDLSDLNSFLTLAGAQRGEHSKIGLNVDALVPSPVLKNHSSQEEASGESSPESSNRKGLISFTLAFDQKAVADVLAASGEQVLRAYAASAPAADRALVQWLADHAALKDGKVDYDHDAADKAFPKDPNSNYSDTAALREISLKAATLISEIASANGTKTNGEKSKVLAMMISGEDPDRPWYRLSHHLAYEEVLAIVIQFVNPMNLTGDFIANVSNGKGLPNTNVHLVLKKGRAENKLLQEAGDAKARFAEPSPLYD